MSISFSVQIIFRPFYLNHLINLGIVDSFAKYPFFLQKHPSAAELFPKFHGISPTICQPLSPNPSPPFSSERTKGRCPTATLFITQLSMCFPKKTATDWASFTSTSPPPPRSSFPVNSTHPSTSPSDKIGAAVHTK